MIEVLWFIGLLVLGFLACFVTSKSAEALQCDGLGRPLTEAPMLMRIVFGQDHMWAGWGWFAVDMVVFWGSIIIAVRLAKYFDSDYHA